MHPNEDDLNEYADGTLGISQRADVDRHLAGCAACRQLVEDLREIHSRVSALRPLAPPDRAWAGIERRLRTPRRAAVWTWLPVAAALMLATAVGVRYFTAPAIVPQTAGGAAQPSAGQGAQGAQGAQAAAGSSELAKSVEDDLLQAEQHYQRAISGLEQIANADKGALDPNTAATLQKNLSVVDQAINESRAALKSQPTSEPAQQSLLDNFKTKIALLQDTVALINEMRKGNDAGAAKIASGLKQKS